MHVGAINALYKISLGTRQKQVKQKNKDFDALSKDNDQSEPSI